VKACAASDARALRFARRKRDRIKGSEKERPFCCEFQTELTQFFAKTWAWEQTKLELAPSSVHSELALHHTHILRRRMLHHTGRGDLMSFDTSTLYLFATMVAGMLGAMLMFFGKQESIPALKWWGTAYLLGAASVAVRVPDRRHAPPRRGLP